ncbi:MAG TPA: hypothetical protein VKG23_07725, partial [Thermoanaerobaculia bacterium]|nr:hypothetical protein [Thermoanaerobaculia bacterium]
LSCASLKTLIDQTYGFRPSQLDAAGRDRKSAQMDAVWSVVEANRSVLVPCLRSELIERTRDTWFEFDGSRLLERVDPSPESRRMLLEALNRVAFEDVDLRNWVEIAASLGDAGLDTSSVGRLWLEAPRAEYWLPEHAAYHVDRENGALFIYGAADERFATPALVELVRTTTGPERRIAVSLLMSQATPESLHALRDVNPAGLSAEEQGSLRALLDRPMLLEARKPPKATREEYVKAFRSFLDGDEKPFRALVEKVPDGERDVVAVCTAEDIDLIRRVRRRMISSANQHAIEYYAVFSKILMTMVWRAGPPAEDRAALEAGAGA